MYPKAKFKTVLLVICTVVFGSASAFGGVPDVTHVMITDVTTVSISVVWAASEASTADLEIYEDEAGTIPVAGAVTTPHPVESGDMSIKTAAEDIGVMKVRVTGLQADTTYFLKTITTSKSSDESTDYPAAAPFMSATTEVKTVRSYNSGGNEMPFSNDIIIEPCYLEDRTTHATGSLVLAAFEAGDYPITAFVGDGVEAPFALIDLNNAYSRDTNETVDCSHGDNLTLLNFRGIEGYSIVTHDVPLDENMSEVKVGEFALKPGENLVSFQLDPNNPDTGETLRDILSKVDSIWSYNPDAGWIFWSPDPTIPGFLKKLSELNSSTGYWLYMNDYASWKVQGDYNPDPIQLNDGENLVGYNSIETLDVEAATESIKSQLESIWTNDPDEGWIFWSPDPTIPGFLKKLKVIEPGKAYYAIVDGSCEWE
jgi:hypothetical protein